MNGQSIVDKIIADADKEAAAIISDAENRAENVVAEANAKEICLALRRKPKQRRKAF